MTIYEVSGIGGSFNLSLTTKDPPRYTLARKIPFRYVVLHGKDVSTRKYDGVLARLSENSAEVDLNNPVHILANLQMELTDVGQNLGSKHFYGKIIKDNGRAGFGHTIRFTSIPPEIDAYFQAHLQYALERD